MAKKRLDVLLVERGLAETREKAQALILAGDVSVDGRTVNKAGTAVANESEVVLAQGLRYVSRGGLKLEHALDALGVDPSGLIALDAGASTGGFTDCMLQRGAARVYAIDVGYGQLDWRLRNDARVVTIERTNIRYLSALPESVDLATADLSFISLTLVLPVIGRFVKPDGRMLVLVKPQFEAGRDQVGKGGVVRDPSVHRAVLAKVRDWALTADWQVQGATPSPILGPAGNREFFLLLGRRGAALAEADLNRVVTDGETAVAAGRASEGEP